MNNKTKSIDLISYFLKYLFLIIIGILLIIGIKDIIEFISFITSDIERRLCIYAAIKEQNNLVSDFLINHNYNVYGSANFSFLDSTTNLLSITNFLKLFEIFKYIYFILISFFIFIILNKYSKNKIFDSKSNKWLLVIGIMISLIPFIYLLRDYIGCLLINKLPIKEPHIYYEDFKFIYLIIGLSIISIYLSIYLSIKNKKQTIYLYTRRILSSIVAIVFIYYSITNIANLINVIKTEKDLLLYNKLLQNKHSFIRVLINNDFELFGLSWTYLGYNTNLKTPLIFYYITQFIINLSLGLIFAYDCIIHIKNNNPKLVYKKEIIATLIFIISSLLNMFVMMSVIDKYNDQKYFNTNLQYSLFNLNYLYIIIPMIFVVVISLTLNKTLENKKKG